MNRFSLQSVPPSQLIGAGLVNLLLAGLFVYAAVLHDLAPGTYYHDVQEDEYLEWASFWAFMIAAAASIRGAVGQWRAGRLPWFYAGVALFCVLVAMEEISWGQRVLGYRPPPYFLAENFQQELNFHNVISTALRKLALAGVIAGFGLVLPLLSLWRPSAGLLQRLGIVAPPAWLMPGFALMLAMYLVYPWSHTGEWVELALGLGFVAAMTMCAWRDTGSHGWLTAVLAAWVLAFALGIGTAAVSGLRTPDPRYVEAAAREVTALQADFRRGRLRTRCGLHKRLYTFVEKYGFDFLNHGRFAGLRASGLSAERARFFLDPWNSPYWVRHDCKQAGAAAFIYSFGPNRRRDSSRRELQGDDIGAYLLKAQ